MESLAFGLVPSVPKFSSNVSSRPKLLPKSSLLSHIHRPLRSLNKIRAAAISSSRLSDSVDISPDIADTHILQDVTSLEDARESLKSFLGHFLHPGSSSGVLRFQVSVTSNIKALDWLQNQPDQQYPQFYYSSRNCHHDIKFNDLSTDVACIGSALVFRGTEPFSSKDWTNIHRFLPKKSPFVRAYGAMRFNPNSEPSTEWEPFGTFFFFIPQVELCEVSNRSVILAANLIWGETTTFNSAVDALLSTLSNVSVQVSSSSPHVQDSVVRRQYLPDIEWWRPELERVVETLKDDQKVVMARRTELQLDGDVKPLSLLSSFQKNDPTSYQFFLKSPNGSCFMGNTPEQMFARNGDRVTSDAVAGTRHRGATFAEDHTLRLDLLQSPKDRIEFEVAENRIKNCLQCVCKNITTPIKKGILKQHRVQHMHTLYAAQLKDNYQESDLLASVYPASYAKKAPITSDAFDRGMYSGPVGWFGSQGAEFAVGLRSALLHSSPENSTRMFVYAGVGVVKGSTAESEWRELNLKTSQFDILQPKELTIVNSEANYN